jgi:hypothetical protein
MLSQRSTTTDEFLIYSKSNRSNKSIEEECEIDEVMKKTMEGTSK